MLLIIFTNLTITTKFKKLAKAERISGVRIIQTPSIFSDNGCSYAVSAPIQSKGDIFHLISKSGIYPVSIYKIDDMRKGNISYTKIK